MKTAKVIAPLLKRKQMRKILTLILGVAVLYSADAQDYLGIYANTNNIVPIITDGPSNTNGTFYFSPNNNTSVNPATGALGVSAVYTDQQYAVVNEAGPVHSAMMFGGQSNNTGKELLTKKLMVPMNDVGTPSDEYYMPATDIMDMGVSQHYAFEQYVSVEELQNMNRDNSQAHYMGKITYTFTEAVDNPVLHVTGMGGFFSSQETFISQLYSVSYKLNVQNNVEGITKLDGTSFTELSGDTIRNKGDFLNFVDTGYDGTSGDETGSGSFQILGNNISEVVFDVIMEGKAIGNTTFYGTSVWSTFNDGDGTPDTIESEQKYTGDRFNTTWTIPLYDFSGSVVVDNVVNGSTEGEDGLDNAGQIIPGGPYTSGSEYYEPLYAVLVGEDGKVEQVVPVDSNDGTFTFSGVLGDTYTVQLQTTQPIIGSTAPNAASLPSEYVATEEEFNNGGSDGVSDAVTNAYLVDATSENIIGTDNLIFGIRRPAAILPVELMNFNAFALGVDAVLEWATASEVNNDRFEIERSVDGKLFEKIGEVRGAGTATDVQRYSFLDQSIGREEEVVLYRLRQVDYDGKYTYSEVRPLTFNRENRYTFDLYPNPTAHALYLDVSLLNNNEKVNYHLLAQDGKLLRSSTLEADSSIDVADLEAGTYYLTVLNKKEQIVFSDKFIKL